MFNVLSEKVRSSCLFDFVKSVRRTYWEHHGIVILQEWSEGLCRSCTEYISQSNMIERVAGQNACRILTTSFGGRLMFAPSVSSGHESLLGPSISSVLPHKTSYPFPWYQTSLLVVKNHESLVKGYY